MAVSASQEYMDGKNMSSKMQSYLNKISPDMHCRLDDCIESEQELCDIAGKLTDWGTKYSLLGLSYTEFKEISIMESHPKLQRIEALQKWKNREGTCSTYKNLLQICVKGEWHDSAMIIVGLFQDSVGHTFSRINLSSHHAVKPPSCHSQDALPSGSYVEIEPSLEPPSNNVFAYGNTSDIEAEYPQDDAMDSRAIEDTNNEANTDLSDSHNKGLPAPEPYSSLEEEIADLEHKFLDLARSLLLQLKSNNMRVEKLTACISLLPHSIKKFTNPMWKKICKKKQIETLDCLFTVLNEKIWNILDYHLLEYFINECGNHDLKRRMKRYILELKNFKKKTLVIPFIKCWEGHDRDIPDYKELKVKFDDNNLSLADLDQVWKRLREKTFPSLLKYAGIMYHKLMEEGCCIVSWLLPDQLAQLLKEHIRRVHVLLKEYHVIQVMIGEVYIYNSQYSLAGRASSLPNFSSIHATQCLIKVSNNVSSFSLINMGAPSSHITRQSTQMIYFIEDFSALNLFESRRGSNLEQRKSGSSYERSHLLSKRLIQGRQNLDQTKCYSSHGESSLLSLRNVTGRQGSDLEQTKSGSCYEDSSLMSIRQSRQESNLEQTKSDSGYGGSSLMSLRQDPLNHDETLVTSTYSTEKNSEVTKVVILEDLTPFFYLEKETPVTSTTGVLQETSGEPMPFFVTSTSGLLQKTPGEQFPYRNRTPVTSTSDILQETPREPKSSICSGVETKPLYTPITEKQEGTLSKEPRKKSDPSKPKEQREAQ